LTGVQAFLHEEFTAFCREAPNEFNDHQRDVFCVFSNNGVLRLRDHLNYKIRVQQYAPSNASSQYDDDNDNAEEMIALVSNQGTLMPPIQAYPQPVQGLGLAPPPPPPPPMQNLAHFPQLGGHSSPNRPDLPPLVIPDETQGSPSARSPTHDAPLTIDDEHVRFDSDDDMP
jgi:F-box and leucine-rich repeat protein GRR1